jgi:hypothetical protein
MMAITCLAELIERLEAIKADIASPDLKWAIEHVSDILDDCRDYAELEEPRRPIAKCRVTP